MQVVYSELVNFPKCQLWVIIEIIDLLEAAYNSYKTELLQADWGGEFRNQELEAKLK